MQKILFTGGLMTTLALAIPLAAQHRAGFGGAAMGIGGRGVFAGTGRATGHAHIGSAHGIRNRAFRAPGLLPFGPFLWDDFGYDYPASQPNVVVVTPPRSPAPFYEPPKAPVNAVVQEFPRAAGEPASSTAPQNFFALVTSDGFVQSAIAVWADDSFVYYIDASDVAHRISLDRINREASRKLNRERGLILNLPVVPEP